MSRSTIALLFVVGVFALLGASIFGMYVSAYNYANEAENGIKASFESNKNTLSSYTVKIQEMAQVPAMYKDDLMEVYKSALGARYGEDGSKAMWQWLKEQNPNLDSSLYTKLQQVMEAGRNEFKVRQNELIDRKREYETQRGYFLRGAFIRMAGYPKIDLDSYIIVLDDKTESAFKSGKVEPIKLR